MTAFGVEGVTRRLLYGEPYAASPPALLFVDWSRMWPGSFVSGGMSSVAEVKNKMPAGWFHNCGPSTSCTHARWRTSEHRTEFGRVF